MKRTLKSNHRKKQLNRQHHKMTSRRQSHFYQTLNEMTEQQVSLQTT
jgi:hypothetical protein